MYKEKKCYVRRYRTYGIMVMKEGKGKNKVWDVYYMLSGYPWTYAYGLPYLNHSLSEVFDIAEGAFDFYADDLFNDEED